MSNVYEADLTIQNQKGLHARAAAAFVKSIAGLSATVEVTRSGQTVGGDSVMGLLMLAASKGSVIHLKASGVDAKKAIQTLTLLVDAKFGEE